MKLRAPLVVVLLVTVLAQPFSAQDPSPTPGVIRINVNLVQVDAMVTDSKGTPVTDLGPEDFEVLQDGKPQKIKNFEFIKIREPRARGAARPVNAPARGVPGGIPTPLRPEQVRRTLAIVVDDLGMSFDGIVRTREAIKKWIDNEMQPGDLVAIVRTFAGTGAVQQFTSDKRILYSAIDRVKYQVGRVGVNAFAAVDENRGPGQSVAFTVFDKELADAYLARSLNALRYVIQGVREFPGRKSVILFAEDMSVNMLDSQRQPIEERLRQIADEANRSSVVIHAIDSRGVVYTSPGTQLEDYTASLDGLVLLSQRTGGRFYVDNDFTGSLREAVDDGDGYYLMGYQPAVGTFEPPVGAKPRFHTIKVRVTRPGLKVRSRSGFYGSPDGNLVPLPSTQTRAGQLARALASPFTTPDLRVRLTSLFAYSDKEGAYLKTMLHFDTRDITFMEGPDGARTAQIDIAMVTINENGDPGNAVDKTWRIRVEKDSFENTLKQGLVYSVPLSIKKPGPYQLRVALRDANSKKLGSAMQFIEVPDVKSGRLALSGIVLAADPQPKDTPEGTPAVRVFKAGGAFSYAYEILNVRPNLKDAPPDFDMQMRLYRENEIVYESTPSRLKTDNEKDAKRIAVGGQMQLTKIPPGEYVMQVDIFDSLKKNKNRVAAQSIDFEIR